MKLVVSLVTHNRLAYTQRTLESFLKTINVPYFLVIVDNASTDGSLEWLKTRPHHLIQNFENAYPGMATNIGWSTGLLNNQDVSHFVRLDNDMEFSKDWAKNALKYFEAIDDLGQLGLDYTALETYNGNPDYLTTKNGKTINLWPGNVGGPCVISRKVWDEGLRYDETPWHHDGGPRPTAQEDARFSLEVLVKGFKVGHATEKLAWTFATPDTWSEYPDYYEKTMKQRGYPWER